MLLLACSSWKRTRGRPFLLSTAFTLAFCSQEYDKAIETYQEGLKHDPENHELKEGLMRCVQAINKVNGCCCCFRNRPRSVEWIAFPGAHAELPASTWVSSLQPHGP